LPHNTINNQSFTFFKQALLNVLRSENIIENELLRFAYGTDASFYRLTPKLVLRVENVKQLQQLIKLAAKYQQAITFRAAGTSLSGQAVTDQILIVLSVQWDELEILDNGKLIKLKPAVIGAKANRALAPYQRKIGPDPASINSCKIGGIAANNASGMCCGVKDNSYHTLDNITLVFADSTVLNTADKNSRHAYIQNHSKQIKHLKILIKQLKASPELVKKIRHKYRLKNTTGYGLNALLDFDDIIDVISHLMIGSEGTLAFIADITYCTLVIKPFKMTALYIFDEMNIACQFIEKLATQAIDAVEIMDGSALYSVQSALEKLVSFEQINNHSAALLIEFSANDQNQLKNTEQQILNLLTTFQSHLLSSQPFTTDPILISQLWKIRKGMFPAIGANRPVGTTVIIEDIAFPLPLLAKGVSALQQLLHQYEYHDAIIFGHGLAGNLHFVFTPSFATQVDVNCYDNFMQALSKLVAVEYNGSLKAEHGTGRNMAPFVELEWGKTLYQLMKEIKILFDPQNIFNPDVIINEDKKCHIKQLKMLPKAENNIDKCIECGFCEPVCPSKNLTITPRQRIALWRRIKELERQSKYLPFTTKQQEYLQRLQQDYHYYGIDSCAATGLCAQTCPVDIDTGAFIKSLRAQAYIHKKLRYQAAKQIARYFSATCFVARVGLSCVSYSQKLLGNNILYHSFALLNKVSNNKIPKWYSAWPSSAENLTLNQPSFREKILYIPSCANRIFAPDNRAQDRRTLPEVVCSVLTKAHIEVIIPENIANQCCGMPWFSKGLNRLAIEKRNEFIEMISTTSPKQQWRIITDASPCALTLNQANNQVKVYELSQYIAEYVLPKLTITPTNETFMLHKTCSSIKMDNGIYLEKIARACSNNIIIPEDISCCGFAGDKGFYLPELNKSALQPLKKQIPLHCKRGLSNSRSCEIGLSEQSNISYQSFLYLLDQVSQ